MTGSKFSAPPDPCNPLVIFTLSLTVSDPKQSRCRCRDMIYFSTEVTQRSNPNALPEDIQCTIEALRILHSMRIFLPLVFYFKRSRRRHCSQVNYNTRRAQRKYWNLLPGVMRCETVAECKFLSKKISLSIVSDFQRSRHRCSSKITYNPYRAQRKRWNSLSCHVQSKVLKVGDLICMIVFLLRASHLKRVRRQSYPKISSNIEKPQRTDWDSLPEDMQHKILAGFPLQQVVQFQLVSKSFVDLRKRPTFLQFRLQSKVLKVGALVYMRVFLLRAPRLKRVRRQSYSKISSNTEEPQRTDWDSLPEDMQHKILSGLPLQQVFQFQSVSKSFVDIRKRPTFLQSRLQRYPTEGNFSPMVFFIDPKSGWHWLGFDLNAGVWKRLPSLSFLATPDANLFKEFHVTGSGGLLCVNVSKQPGVEQIIICNPLTGAMRKLPPMNYPRQPVVMNLLLDKDTNNYKVIVAGSAMISSEELSRKTEVYDSITGEWKVAGDVPGPEYALNEFQTGALSEGVLYCIGFISTGDRIMHGLLAYHVKTEKWIHNWECTLPRLPCCQQVAFNTTQLFESEGSIFVYWEQEHSRTLVHFCVAKLLISALSSSQPTMWSVVVSESRVGTRGLLVYPEYLGIGHGHGKVCIFNTLELTGFVYKIEEGITVSQESPLEPMPTSLLRLGGSTTNSSTIIGHDGFEEPTTGASGKPLFFPLNTLTFTFEPSFNTPVL